MARRIARVELPPDVPDSPTREEEAFDPDRVEGWEAEKDDWRAWFDETMTMDPALQLGGEEDTDTQTPIKEKLHRIPEEVKA